MEFGSLDGGEDGEHTGGRFVAVPVFKIFAEEDAILE